MTPEEHIAKAEKYLTYAESAYLDSGYKYATLASAHIAMARYRKEFGTPLDTWEPNR